MKKTSPLENLRILLVDDEPQVLRALDRCLSTIKCDVITAPSGQDALTILRQRPVDIVISDMLMPGMRGDQLMTEIARLYPDTLRLVLTGYADIESVSRAINQGYIWGYLEKPWDNQELILLLERAVEQQQLLFERSLLNERVKKLQQNIRHQFCDFIGKSPSMQFIYNAIENCAPSQASVFITGPSGTGKELAANAIHRCSNRNDGPFVALNCAAIPADLMESEIFGHVKGAFTGAQQNRAGAAAQAEGGTLFLDELAEMDIGLQAKLLRFIQTSEYQPVGSSRTEKANIRFVAATNRTPLEAIENGKLREDLYYRLNVISLQMPTLVERIGDALLLARHFLNTLSIREQRTVPQLSEPAQHLLNNYQWPGNVRQLQNCMHSCVLMRNQSEISVELLASILRLPRDLANELSKPKLIATPIAQASLPEPGNLQPIIPLATLERSHIERAIELMNGNVVEAATRLGVSPSTLYRKIQAWQPE